MSGVLRPQWFVPFWLRQELFDSVGDFREIAAQHPDRFLRFFSGTEAVLGRISIVSRFIYFRHQEIWCPVTDKWFVVIPALSENQILAGRFLHFISFLSFSGEISSVCVYRDSQVVKIQWDKSSEIVHYCRMNAAEKFRIMH